MHTAGSTARILTLSAVLALTACASESSHSSAKASPPPAASASSAGAHAQISEQHSARVGVVAVDKAQRLVTLRGEDGRIFQVKAGDEVRNFDQIAVGDELRVTYLVALSATLLPPGEAHTAPEASVMAARAAPGDKPAASVGAAVSVRVQVESIDAANDIVVCKLSSGELVAHKVATDEGRAFVKRLKPGDLVQLDYAEALALSVEKVSPAKG
jgi:hypothetical protein